MESEKSNFLKVRTLKSVKFTTSFKLVLNKGANQEDNQVLFRAHVYQNLSTRLTAPEAG